MTRPPNVPNTRVGRPTDAIQANGQEYLVTVNGNVFVALTLAEAEAIVNRMRNRRGDGTEIDAAALRTSAPAAIT